jgi:hypothetical protein
VRRLLILALVALVVWAVASPRHGLVAVPGVATLHGVQALFTCETGAIRQITFDPRTADPGACAGIADTLGR